MMDAKDIELDLQALQKLYGLLSRDGQSSATNDKLDEHARLLLKNLLDTETLRVFKAHSEIIAAQVRAIDMNIGRNGSVCATGLEYRKKRCRVCQGSTSKQLKPIEGSKFYDELNRNSKAVTLQNKQKNEFDRFRWDSEKGRGSMVRYRIDDSLKGENETELRIDDDKLSGRGSTAFSSDRVIGDADEVCNSTAETSKELGEIDYLSKDASESIKQIELRISALQLGDELSQRKDFVQQTKSPSPVLQTIDVVVPLIELGREGDSGSIAGNDVQYRLTSQRHEDQSDSHFYPVPIRTMNQQKEMKLPNLISSHPSNMFQRTDSTLGQSTSRIIRSRGPNMGRYMPDKLAQSSQELEGYSIEGEQNPMLKKSPNWPVHFSSQTITENPYQNQLATEERISRYETFRPYMPLTRFSDYGAKNRNIQSVSSGYKIMGSNPRDKPVELLVPSGLYEYQLDQRHYGVPSKYTNPLRSISSHHQDLENTPSSSYSSSWISQQASSLVSESTEHSMPVRNTKARYVSSGSSSDTATYFPSNDTESHYTSYTSNSEDEVYSLASSAKADRVSSNSSSNSDENSSYDQPIHRHPGPTFLRTRSMKRSTHRMTKQKKIGKWKRLKDRLATIIFHHHHHHHHYDNDSGDDCGNDRTTMSNGKPLQRTMGKHFRPRREDEGYGEQAVEKLGKSLIHDRRSKTQHKHFHGLMEGLFRHVRHSKRSKPAKDSIAQLGKGQKKPLKKLHWWQLLKRHRGSKMPNKPPNVKLGLNKKRARLRALPSMK